MNDSNSIFLENWLSCLSCSIKIKPQNINDVVFVLYHIEEFIPFDLVDINSGRALRFIEQRFYMDKTRCYECRESSDLSYECPKNQLGPKERPIPKHGR